jgi:4-hydroxy-tetrahydrodipicolinate synthase
MRIDWKGIVPALSTPCDETGMLDEESLRSQVRWNIEVGAHGLAVSLMAGEFEKFSEEERKRTFEIVIDEAKGQVPVLVGASHSGTEVAVQLAQYGEKLGADGVVVLPPYFFLQSGRASACLYEHYATIASRVSIPIMIQDCEGAGPAMYPTLLKRLADDFDNIVSFKLEGQGSYQKAVELREMTPDVVLFGGMAARNMLNELRIGVSGNIPDACLTDVLVDIYAAYRTNETEKAETLFKDYLKWADFLLVNNMSNIEVEKETLRQRGVIKSSFTRLPYGILLSDAKKQALAQVLKEIGLWKGGTA